MGFFGVDFEDLLLNIFEKIFFSQFPITNVHIILGFCGRRFSLKNWRILGWPPSGMQQDGSKFIKLSQWHILANTRPIKIIYTLADLTLSSHFIIKITPNGVRFQTLVCTVRPEPGSLLPAILVCLVSTAGLLIRYPPTNN